MNFRSDVRNQEQMKNHHPPDWMDRFLEWYCSEYYLEEVQGDLHEWFYRRVKKEGVRRARFHYFLDVLRYFSLFRVKHYHKLINHSNYLSMRTILKITYRNLKRNKLSGMIRLGNLVLGISVFLLAFIYARYELNYDQYHKKANKIYRVGLAEAESVWAATPLGMGAFAVDNIPEVKRMTRFIPIRNTWVKYGDDIFYEKRGFSADSSIFQMFTYTFLQGDPQTALKSPDAIVLTEQMTRKYFGDENPMGKTLELLIDEGKKRVVTGVIKDVPNQSHLRFDFLCSIYSIPDDILRTWRNFFVYTFLELEDDGNYQNVKNLIKEEFADQYKLDASEDFSVALTPLTKIHLFANHEKEYANNGNVVYVYILFCIGLFVLVISSINFINLTVIKGLDRGREIGLRKTVGASKGQLIVQFLGENLIFLLVAGIVACCLLALLAPFFQRFSGLELPLSFIKDPFTVLVPMGLILLGLELIGGLYPAFVLSRFQPAEIIKPGAFTTLPMKKVGAIRKLLIVAQFSLSIILVIGSIVVYDQLKFMQSQDLGFEKDQVVIFPLNSEINQKLEPMKDRLIQVPGIKSIATSSSVPGYRIMYEGIHMVGEPEDQGSRLLLTDDAFLRTYDIEILQGKPFSKLLPEGQTEYIMNEKMANLMFSDGRHPIGKQLVQWGDTGRIVAIVKDFNFQSLHKEVEPLTIKRSEQNWGYASIKFEAKSASEVLEAINKAGEDIFPELPPIETEFLNDQFEELYRAEIKLQSIVWIFCVITILLTVSGIFGIATYNAQKRAKEMAIRKILGGTLVELMRQLSKSFIYLLLASLFIGLPGAYLLSRWWLQDFAYQTSLDPFIFAISTCIMLIIILVSSGWVTFKAATNNPADVLKSE